jgi:phosphoglycerate dehydrogenase-like enzyme
MKILVAIYSPFACWCIPDEQVEWLRREFPQHAFVRADSDPETLERIADADIVFGATVRPDQLAAARRLRWIHSPAAGIGNMLFPEMVASPVVMTNSRGNSAATIAEHVVAVTLALLRDLPLAWRRQTEGKWAQDEFNAGARVRLLRDCRVLIVGFGSIGRETGRLMAALGATVVGIRRQSHSQAPRPNSQGGALGVEEFVLGSVPLGVGELGIGSSVLGIAELGVGSLLPELSLADVVVIAAPQTQETLHMIGQAELASMKPGAILVNVSRGKLVDEVALARALETGRLRGVALDVFEHEPLASGSPFWAREDVLITPHVSGFQSRHWQDAAALFAGNLRRFEAGQELLNPVDKAAGY